MRAAAPYQTAAPPRARLRAEGIWRAARAFAARAHGPCAPRTADNGIGDDGAKELAAALEANTTLNKLDLQGACRGAPPNPVALPRACVRQACDP